MNTFSSCCSFPHQSDREYPRLPEYDSRKLLKAFKKVCWSCRPLRLWGVVGSFDRTLISPILQEFACNGTLVEDEEAGKVIQLQGDQRVKIQNFLAGEGIPKHSMKLHGF